jgi:AAA family ATP:ADP antiporter
MTTTSRSMITAMICAAAVTGEFVGGKATRDALFLTSFDITALPTMLIATSICSILLIAANARWGGKVTPAILVPAAFFASGVLFLCEWLLRATAPSATSVIVYLHISGAGPLLASGFWLVASERFDPRTAKRRFGQIAGAGTLGGLLGALMSERVAALFGVPSMLLFLALLQFFTAWLVRILAVAGEPEALRESRDSIPGASLPLRTGLRAIGAAPHLRHLMALVLFGTTSAALLEYLFKAKAVETFGPGDSLLRFFALYYAATSVISFGLQTLGSRKMLERFGLGLTTSTPSIALLAGSLGTLAAPGFGSLLVARAGESIFRASWFRAGYELFYAPMPAAEKRAAKSVIDVALDRVGDAVGGSLVRIAVVFVPVAAQSSVILFAAMGASALAIVAASHLNRWYLRSLENSLVLQAGHVEAPKTGDGSTTRVLLSIERREAIGDRGRRAIVDTDRRAAELMIGKITTDPVVEDILSLRSANRERVVDVLSRPNKMPAALVPHVLPLLSIEPVADYAVFALRKVANERVGELLDALLDPNQEYAVRRRVARTLSAAPSQRAADGLMQALDDARFDVRFQSARSLVAILETNSEIRIDRQRIESVVLREVTVGRSIWEGQRLLAGTDSESPLDDFVRDRASHSLAHVFNLLSLVLPREPLQIAFRSLHSEDRLLRGTALEYLEGVLPAPIRQGLWPFLVRARGSRPAPKREEILANLLRSNPSVTLVDLAEKLKAARSAEFSAV